MALRSPSRLGARRAAGWSPARLTGWPTELDREVNEGRLSPLEVLQRLNQLRAQAPVRSMAPEPPSAAPAKTLPPLDEAALQAALHELHTLIGLQKVKAQVRELVALARVGRWRRAVDLPVEPQSLHLLFHGHPGTGKTTVARILGRLFKALGLLPRGHLVEVERADLVGEYIGHTAQKTREVMRRAEGGILFLDEAYSLARGGEKDFGKEAIDCLVRGMEEHRADLVVILAGYPAEMETFLAQNPGLRSRFPTQIHFPDYDTQDLLQIASSMLGKGQYTLAPAAQSLLSTLLNEGRCHGQAGNARAVRNLLERTIRRQALRLVGDERSPAQPVPGRSELMELTRADLEAAMQA